MAQELSKDSPEPANDKRMLARVRGALHGPLLVGIVAAVVAIALSFFGMLREPQPTALTWQNFLLVILAAGGSWGLIAWAIATAAVEAGKD